MLGSKKYPYLASLLLVITFFSLHAAAQDRNIWNEYRPTLVMAMPINEKWIAWQYAVFVYSPETKKKYARHNWAGRYLQAVRQEGLGRLVRAVGRDALRTHQQLPHDEQL